MSAIELQQQNDLFDKLEMTYRYHERERNDDRCRALKVRMDLVQNKIERLRELR